MLRLHVGDWIRAKLFRRNPLLEKKRGNFLTHVIGTCMLELATPVWAGCEIELSTRVLSIGSIQDLVRRGFMSSLLRSDRIDTRSRWYVLRSKPYKEDALWRQAVSRGFEIFYPRVPVKSVNPRARKVAPYFPGYVFVRANLEEGELSTFQWMPHSYGLIELAGFPADVPDDLIDAIHRRVEAINAAGGELLLDLHRGDLVQILSGPLAGYEAIFDARLNGGERVRVLLSMLTDRRVSVDLQVGQIARKR